MCRAKVNGREEALTLQFVVFLSQCAAIEELVGHTHTYRIHFREVGTCRIHISNDASDTF